MEIERRVVLAAPPEAVYHQVDDLTRYPAWMELVHDVEVSTPDTSERPAWEVELRARVGPFARSKRLRMTRTVHEPASVAVFERSETDGRAHARWLLEVRLTPIDGSGLEGPSTDLAMLLRYDGSLWSGAVLQRVLDDHVERGAAALVAMFGAPG
jgi:hypothetical protein